MKKRSYIIRSKHWETDELRFDSSYFAPFKHVTGMQMTPFLSAFGEEEKSYLNLLMPLCGGRYNRSAEVVEMRDPQSLNTGLNRTLPGWAKIQKKSSFSKYTVCVCIYTV